MNLISGIQQIGIGVHDVDTAFAWFRKTLGINTRIFDDEAEAPLMINYTGNKIQKRRAILAMNMNGGGGAEIWQFTSRKSEVAPSKIKWGDLGINAVKIKSNDISRTHAELNGQPKTNVCQGPDSEKNFFVHDENNNAFQFVVDHSWFKKLNYMQGGVCGAIIGVSDMDKSVRFYKDAFGLNTVVYDVTGTFNDLGTVNENKKYRRVLLKLKNDFHGAFSRLLGDVQIELIQALDDKPVKIFENRYWGDIGFIHLCFDVPDMNKLKHQIEKSGYHLCVDSGDTFDMGNSGGRFAYVEDPDGTLIEMVETHKVPVMKKFGIYINLKKRKMHKPLPNWMVGMLEWNKV